MKTTLLALLLTFAAVALSQCSSRSAQGVPRGPDGKVNLTAPVPRATDGKPDLSGVWHVEPTGRAEMKRLFGEGIDTVEVPGMEIDTVSKYAFDILLDYEPADAFMRPAAAAIFRERAKGLGKDLPSTHCLPTGIPLSTLVSEFHKIVQTPDLIIDMLELDSAHRQIYTDGRKFPPDPNPSWLGYSIGKWEGDTLVVETVGFHDKSWLDVLGHPRSETTKMTERYRRRDFGHLDIEMMIEDPNLYTKPFGIKVTHQLAPDSDIYEYFCMENEKDRAHMGFK
jgi:hypothetical protein